MWPQALQLYLTNTRRLRLAADTFLCRSRPGSSWKMLDTFYITEV